MSRVAIFRTSDADAFVCAVKFLEKANIKFWVEDVNERGAKIPLRVQWIYVEDQDADKADEVVSSIPSTYIMPTNQVPSTRSDRSLGWLMITPLIALIIFFIIRMIISS